MSQSKISSTGDYEESTEVQILPDDLALASQLAQKNDVDVETYIKALIHNELMKEAKAS
jgi:hypothetical protein